MKYRIARVRRRNDGEEIDLSHLFAILPAERPQKKPSRPRALLRRIRACFAAWRARRATRPSKTAILLGALCSASLVLLLSGTIILLSFVSPYLGRAESVTVPSLVGASALDLPDDGRFSYIITYEHHPDVPSGHVISQSPTAGVTRRVARVGGTCTISLTVSRKKSAYVLPTLLGLSSRDAILELRNHGIPYTLTSAYSDTAAVGQILACEPAAGASLDGTSSVTLTVSQGPMTVYVATPNLIGLSEMAAQTRLLSAGLATGQVRYTLDDAPIGTVLSQSIPQSERVPIGTEIDLVVSAGRTHSDRTVPSLYGMTLEAATAALREAGLVTGEISGKGHIVISQSPAPGTIIHSAIVSVDLHLGS